MSEKRCEAKHGEENYKLGQVERIYKAIWESYNYNNYINKKKILFYVNINILLD